MPAFAHGCEGVVETHRDVADEQPASVVLSEGRAPRAPDFLLSCIMPGQQIQFTLKRPVLGPFYQAVLDGIFPKIKPLLMITFTVT